MESLFKKTKYLLLTIISSLILTGIFTWTTLSFAQQATTFGGTYLVSNTSNPAFADPVNAVAGDIVQFYLRLENTGSDVARNVRVRATLPQNISGNSIASTVTVTSDNAPTFSETATVNVPGGSGSLSLTYFPGHAVLIRHPGNVNHPAEGIGSGEIHVGDVHPGAANYLEVTFKATVNRSASQPTASCPNVSWGLPSNIAPNQDIQVRVNTSGGQNWSYATLYIDGARVSGGVQQGNAFVYTVNSGAAGSTHNLEFRVNDFRAYGINQDGVLSCGTTQFTTAQPQSPAPASPTPAPSGQGGNTNNNTNTNTNTSSNSNTNTNNNTATGGSSSSTSSSVNSNTNTASASASATGGSASATGGQGGSASVNVTVPSPTVVVQGGTTSTTTTTARTTSSVASAQTTAAAPKVIATAGNQEITQLPKTGLPLLAWGLAGLLPAGLKLRGGKKTSKENNASEIWQERMFKR